MRSPRRRQRVAICGGAAGSSGRASSETSHTASGWSSPAAHAVNDTPYTFSRFSSVARHLWVFSKSAYFVPREEIGETLLGVETDGEHADAGREKIDALRDVVRDHATLLGDAEGRVADLRSGWRGEGGSGTSGSEGGAEIRGNESGGTSRRRRRRKVSIEDVGYARGCGSRTHVEHPRGRFVVAVVEHLRGHARGDHLVRVLHELEKLPAVRGPVLREATPGSRGRGAPRGARPSRDCCPSRGNARGSR